MPVGVNALKFQTLMDSKIPNYCVDSRKWDGCGGGAKDIERDCCETEI